MSTATVASSASSPQLPVRAKEDEQTRKMNTATSPPSRDDDGSCQDGSHAQSLRESFQEATALPALTEIADSSLLYTGELHRILTEVAQTAKCLWLPWAEGPDKAGSATENASQLAFDQQCSRLDDSEHGQEVQAASHDRLPKNGIRETRKYCSNGVAQAARKRPLPTSSTSRLSYGDQFAPAAPSVEAARLCHMRNHQDGCNFSGSDADHDLHLQYASGTTSGDLSTNSECSPQKKFRTARLNNVQSTGSTALSEPHRQPSPVPKGVPPLSFACQREAFHFALGAVLDKFYKDVGYRPCPAERQRFEQVQLISKQLSNGRAIQNNRSDSLSASNHANSRNEVEPTSNTKFGSQSTDSQQESATAAEYSFLQRRERLLSMLESPSTADASAPFTLQRVAEVLLAPKRYYTQTHKLCNCLEKLLLLTASESDLDGLCGGINSQSMCEHVEVAALAEERGRKYCEVRLQRLNRRRALDSEELSAYSADDCEQQTPEIRDSGAFSFGEAVYECDENGRLYLEAAGRANLRTRFDHASTDVHSIANGGREHRADTNSRGMSSSPPPPNCALSFPAHVPILRHGNDLDHTMHLSARVPSPILFHHDAEPPAPSPLGTIHANASLQLLQLHHAAALAGVSPFHSLNISARDHSETTANLSLLGGSGRDIDVESRSSCSSDIDIDSESDVSFDDSASDRSDGSDCGHVEPMSAARAMALSRLQHQQRHRVLQSSSQTSGSGVNSPAQSENVRLDSESEGDSIDSTRAEDSAGSDSSSDMAD